MFQAEIDYQLALLNKKSQETSGRKTSALINILKPISKELTAAQRVNSIVRKQELQQRLNIDMNEYNEELEKQGKCLWVDRS